MKCCCDSLAIVERHRHRFEVNPSVVPLLEEKGLRFVATCTNNERMEILELDRILFGPLEDCVGKEHPYFVACQYHPEFLSRPFKPSPVFKGLILAAIGRLDQFIENYQATH